MDLQTIAFFAQEAGRFRAERKIEYLDDTRCASLSEAKDFIRYRDAIHMSIAPRSVSAGIVKDNWESMKQRGRG